MDIISYIHKAVALLFQILELVEVWTHRSMELSPKNTPPRGCGPVSRIVQVEIRRFTVRPCYCVWKTYKHVLIGIEGHVCCATANVDYRLSFADQGKLTSVFRILYLYIYIYIYICIYIYTYIEVVAVPYHGGGRMK